MRADTSDVAFRLLLALGEMWEGLQRAGIATGTHGLYLTNEYLGGYLRISAGPGSHARVVVEWNESSRHLRILRCEEWPGFEAAVSATVAHVRNQARERGLGDMVDPRLVRACQDQLPTRRTVASGAIARVPAGARRV